MRKFDLQAYVTSVLLMGTVLLCVCSLGTLVQAAGPASVGEPAHSDVAQGVQQNTSPAKAPAKKK